MVLLLVHVTNQLRIPFIDNLEACIYDTRLRLTMPRTLDSRISSSSTSCGRSLRLVLILLLFTSTWPYGFFVEERGRAR